MNKLKELEQVCSSCSANVKADVAVNELVNPLCKEAHKVNERISTPKLNTSTSVDILNKSGENQKRLHGLLSHIDKVINIIKQYKTEGFISSSVEKFIEIRNEVKEKMEAHINSAPFCDICKETIEYSNNNGNLASRAGLTKCVDSTSPPNKSTENLPCPNSIYDLTDVTRSKLGCFEKKYKEIVKVKRLQNEDGSVNEEKQIITIRTEMRNPQEISGPNSKIDENEKYFDSSVVDGMSHGEDTLHLNLDKLNSRTKPEYTTEHHQTSEPKFRAYTSAGQPKETMNEGSNVSKNSCNAQTKILKNSAADLLIYCPKKTTSDRGSLQSSTVIQGAMPLCEQVPTPITDNIISIEKSTKDKRDCSLPFHLNEVTSSHDKTIKSKSISTNVLCRDVWTSTTDLLSIPSKILNTKPKLTLRQEAIGKEKEMSKQVKQSNSCCIVKIIPKSAKISYVQYREKPNQDPQKVVLNILDIIKKTYMPSNSTIQNPSLEVSKENRTRNICDRCKATLNDSSLLKSSLSTSKKCGVKSVKGQNAESISRYPSYSSMSCKSIGVGSANMGIGEIHFCGNLSTPSIPSRKRMFFLVTRNSEGSDSKTCCKMNQTIPKSVGCSTTRSSSSGCSCKKTSASVKYTPAYLKTRDVATSTRRSTRFDVRPITRRHTRKKINLEDCTCHSDSCFFEDKVQEMVSSSRSYNDG